MIHIMCRMLLRTFPNRFCSYTKRLKVQCEFSYLTVNRSIVRLRWVDARMTPAGSINFQLRASFAWCVWTLRRGNAQLSV